MSGIVVFDGNSLTLGNGATAGNDYPSQVTALLTAYGAYTKYNYGVGGQTTTLMAADAAAQIDVLYATGNGQNIVCAWEITNELYFGVAPETAYANFVSYCQARQAVGFQVVALTVLPRSNAGTPVGFEAARQTANTLLRANWATFADALADVAADGRIGDAGDELNTTYYDADRVHMSNTGYGVVAALVVNAIRGLPTVTVLTLQPDATTGKDASLLDLPNDNTGNDLDFDVGYYAAGNSTRRGLIEFDLSSVPANAIISYAVLSLWLSAAGNAFSSNNRTHRVYRLRAGRDWVETQALWSIYKTGSAWTTPGCGSTTFDREGTEIGSADLTTSLANGAQVDFVLDSGMVQDWVDGTLPNNGMIFISDGEANDLIRYHASDGATPSLRPQLVVVYTVPVIPVVVVVGSTPQAVAETWIFGALAAGAALTALLTDGTAGIYNEIIPQAANLPAVVFFVNFSSDLNNVGPLRIQTTLEYVVKAVTKAEGYGPANAIDAQLDALIQAGSGTVTGGTVWGCMRISPLRFMELDNGVQYRHAGGIYRLYAQTA